MWHKSLLLVCALVTVAACKKASVVSESKPCGGCASGYLCRNDQCWQVCNLDTDCSAREACLDGVCQEAFDECRDDSDCRGGVSCEQSSSGTCVGGRCHYAEITCTQRSPVNPCRLVSGTCNPQRLDGTCHEEQCCEFAATWDNTGTAPACPLAGEDPNQNGVQEGGEVWSGTCTVGGQCAGCTLVSQCDDTKVCTRDDCAQGVCVNDPEALVDSACTVTATNDGRCVSRGSTADCLLIDGQPCSADGNCQHDHCAWGVCCDVACNGTCERCDVGPSVGACIDTDYDSDGLCGAEDPCPHNPNNDDPDHDGLCAGDDLCPDVASTDLADSDADGHPNAADNCLCVPNPGQADFDHDDVGDACDDVATGFSPARLSRVAPAPLTIWVDFGVTIDGGTLDETTFTISDGDKLIPATVAFDGTRATLTPTTVLEAGRPHVVELAPTVARGDGVAIGPGHRWSFTYDTFWPTSWRAQRDTATDQLAQVVAGLGDDAMAIWNHIDGDAPPTVVAQRYDPASHWIGAPVTVYANADNWVEWVVAGSDEAGDAVAAWAEYSGTTGLYEMRAAVYRASTQAWSSPGLVGGDEGCNVISAAINTSGSGFVMYSCLNFTATTSRLAVRRFTNFGATWVAEYRLADCPTTFDCNVYTGAVYSHRSGDGVAIWLRQKQVSYADFSNLTSSWGTTQVLGSCSSSCLRLAVGANDSGEEVASWIDWSGTRRPVLAARHPGGGWTAPAITIDPAFRPLEVAVDVAPDGSAIVGWKLNTDLRVVQRHQSAWETDPVTIVSPNVSLSQVKTDGTRSLVVAANWVAILDVGASGWGAFEHLAGYRLGALAHGGKAVAVSDDGVDVYGATMSAWAPGVGAGADLFDRGGNPLPTLAITHNSPLATLDSVSAQFAASAAVTDNSTAGPTWQRWKVVSAPAASTCATVAPPGCLDDTDKLAVTLTPDAVGTYELSVLVADDGYRADGSAGTNGYVADSVTLQVLAETPLLERVLVVYNAADASGDSLDVANHYVTARGIPAGQLCAVSPTSTTTVDWSVYEAQIVAPIKACLDAADRKKILYLALSANMPYQIVNMPGGSEPPSLDGNLTDIWDSASAGENSINNPFLVAQASATPTFNAYEPFAVARRRANAPLLYMVMRFDGVDRATIETNMIDAPLAVEANPVFNTGVLNGAANGCFDQDFDDASFAGHGDGGADEVNWDVRRLHEATASVGFTNTVEMTGSHIGYGGASVAQCDNALVFGSTTTCGWYFDNDSGTPAPPPDTVFTFAPGAVALFLTCGEPDVRNASSNYLTAQALKHGAAVGHTWSSQTYWGTDLLQMDGVVRDMLQGAPAGDAFMRNQKYIKRKNLFYGDPLYRPFPLGLDPF